MVAKELGLTQAGQKVRLLYEVRRAAELTFFLLRILLTLPLLASSAMSALFQAMQSQQMNMNAIAAPAADSQASTASTSSDTQSEGKQLTYPKPRNFAERLMYVLETGAASDALWWVEGKAVALHQKRLKKGTAMKDFFNVKEYSGFIRNCNRW